MQCRVSTHNTASCKDSESRAQRQAFSSLVFAEAQPIFVGEANSDSESRAQRQAFMNLEFVRYFIARGKAVSLPFHSRMGLPAGKRLSRSASWAGHTYQLS